MIPKDLDAIGKADIDALITNKVPETRTLEYKETLPGNADNDKKEFLADISSFANASGGDVIYGIRGAVDANNKKTGEPDAVVPLQNTTADQAKLRLEQMIQSSIQPRLSTQIREVSGWGADGSGFVLVVRIRKSLSAPHMVMTSSKFFGRNSAGKYQLDVREIQHAVLATAGQSDRVRRFIIDRVAQVTAGETPVPVVQAPTALLHVVPLTSFLENARLDLSNRVQLSNRVRPPRFGPTDYRYNLEGFVAWNGAPNTPARAYTQLFVDGAVESLLADIVIPPQHIQGNNTIVQATATEPHLIRVVQECLRTSEYLGTSEPFAVGLTILNARGAFVWTDQLMLGIHGAGHALDRQVAVLPVTLIESVTNANVADKLKPLFDSLWNAFGYPSCPNYGPNGQRL